MQNIEKTQLKAKTLTFFIFVIIMFFCVFFVCVCNSSEKPLLFSSDKDYPPLTYLENSLPKGMDVEIIQQLSRVIGKDISIQLMQWDIAQQKALIGEVDIIGSMAKSEKREKLYDFSETIWVFEYSLFVNIGTIGIKELKDLNNKRAGVTYGGYPYQVLTAMPEINLVKVKNYIEGFQLLKENKIDVLAADKWVGSYFIFKEGITGITIIEKPFAERETAYAVKKGNTQLLYEINRGIRELREKGIVEQIQNRWSSKKVVFFTKEKIKQILEITVLILIAVFLIIMSSWIYTLKKQISERKKAEKELKKYHEHLEEIVSERTMELEKTNKELNDFAYIVSHDLKAPLRGITSLATWLEQDYSKAIDSEGQEMLNMLKKRVNRMENLINGVLQYSRVIRIKEDNEGIDLNILVKEVIDLLAPPENIHIAVKDNLPVIYAEKTRIGQVFQNLLGNAIKFMDKPSGVIELHCTDKGQYWEFCISDNGPGIDEKYHEKIFQIFQTLKSRDEFESTGIGLTIVKKIVELEGGKIWLESKTGEGSRFYFTKLKKEQPKK